MLITSEVRAPAMILRVASGNSTRRRSWSWRNPAPRFEELRVHLADPRVRCCGRSDAALIVEATTTDGTRRKAGREFFRPVEHGHARRDRAGADAVSGVVARVRG